MIRRIYQDLRKAASPAKKKVLQRFFKTGPGQYGEGDVFLGVTVPACRRIALARVHASAKEVRELLFSEIHEARLVGLLILVEQFKGGDAAEQKKIFNFYLKHARRVNNWDLVDLSAAKIVGVFLLERDKSPLDRLVRSTNLWERRIGMVATWHFIREGHFHTTLRLVVQLMRDPQDLMHKACGWMLREVGKKDEVVLETFLRKQFQKMPRTMLRYAIEHFSVSKRKKYLNGKVNQ